MRPRLILDTNVVLDLFVFDEPTLESLRSAIVDGDATWLSSPACRAELEQVLDYPAISAFLARRGWAPETRWRALAMHDRLAKLPPPAAEAPARSGAAAPRCADPKDQFLIDLAIDTGADYLISKDRHLLQLAGELRKTGHRSRILRPGDLPTGWAVTASPVTW